MGTKKCTKCGEEKPLDGFHKKTASSDGRASHCKACRARYWSETEDIRARWTKYYIENADRFREQKARARKEDPVKAREGDARYRERYPERVKARKAVYHALRSGRLTMPEGCSMCPSVTRPEAHHEDCSRPLDVTWLCKLCHAEADRLLQEKLANSSSQKSS